MSQRDLDYVLAAATVVALFLAFLGISARRPSTPSGPKSSWFGMGRPNIPRITDWRTYGEWGDVYGDMIFYRIYGNPVLIINSAKIADDLLDKRGVIYSSRPARTMTRDLMGWSWSLVGMEYGPTWRKYRGLFEKHFRSRVVPVYKPIEVKGVRTLLQNFNRSPEDFEKHLHRSAAALVMNISYGHDVTEDDDVYVTLVEKGMKTLGYAGVYGTYVVDYLPFLKYIPTWFPGAEFKRKAYEWRKLSQAMLEEPFEMVKQKTESGVATPCIVTRELENSIHSGTETDVRMIQSVAAVSYSAGADTTMAATMTFLLAMVLHPNIQRKAQGEIDRVVGTDRLPSLDDRDKMPFIAHVMWESLRWNPVAPLALSHATVQDDIYEGYWIPKGTTIQPNVWGMLHDERRYPDSSKFKPERFEDPKRNTDLGINELPLIAFGFGRRICPGRWVAMDNLWITIASILAVYNIAKATDQHGNVINPIAEFTTGLVSRPKPFKCVFIPHSGRVLALIEKTEDEHQD